MSENKVDLDTNAMTDMVMALAADIQWFLEREEKDSADAKQIVGCLENISALIKENNHPFGKGLLKILDKHKADLNEWLSQNDYE